jgi:hypothetical protein
MKNQKFNGAKKLMLLCVITATLLLSSCASRKFVCNSVPEHALITAQTDTASTGFHFVTFTGETPTTAKLAFLGRNDKYYLKAEKRGYYPYTKVVSKDSALSHTFTLKKIEGVSEALYPKENLKNATFYLLPPKITFLYHKGSGAFEKYEPDANVSNKINEDLLKDIMARNKPTICVVNFDGKDACKAYKDSLPSEFLKYVLNLKENHLNYYAYPPSVAPFIAKFGDLRETLQNHPSVTNHRFFVCVTGTCISQTAGRAVGQVFLTVASRSYVPTNDSGTTLNLFLIDAETLEVVHIYNKFYKENMAKPEELRHVNDGVTQYLSNL